MSKQTKMLAERQKCVRRNLDNDKKHIEIKKK